MFLQKILIVDDAELIRTMLQASLEKLGFSDIHQAASGFEAESLVEGQHFDLIITDIHMENGNGIVLLKSVKMSAVLRHIPVIMISTSSDKELVIEAIAIGATDYLIKPFKTERVRQKVFKALGIN